MTGKRLTVISFIIGTFTLALLQFSIPQLFGADGYLHLEMSRMIRDQGHLLTSLPQAKFSYFNSPQFVDKDFLFHLYLIPFTYLPGLTGAKLGALLLSLFWLGTFSFIIYRTAPRHAWWLILLTLTSSQFLITLSRPRPMIISFALLLWCLFALIYRRYKLLFIATFVYGLAHITAPLVIIFSLVYTTIIFVKQRFLVWQPIILTTTAVSLTYLVHPNFPHNLFLLYLNGILVPFYATTWGVLELGAEFFPYSIADYLSHYPPFVIILPSLVYLAYRFRRRLSVNQISLLVISVGLFYLSFKSRRHAALALPILTFTFASLLPQKKLFPNLSPYLLPLITLAILLPITLTNLSQSIYSTNLLNSHYQTAAQQLNRLVPTGKTVYTSNWSDPQYFIGLSPTHNYFVTLDPIYMYHWNKSLYQKYRDIAMLADPASDKTLINTFNTHYGYTDKFVFGRFAQYIQTHPDIYQILWEDRLGLIFAIIPPTDS